MNFHSSSWCLTRYVKPALSFLYYFLHDYDRIRQTLHTWKTRSNIQFDLIRRMFLSKIIFVLCLGLFIILNVNNSYAAKLSSIELSGFLTASITQSRNNKDTPYLNGLATKDLSMSNYENRMGLQIKAPVNVNTELTAMFIARGGNSNYNLTTDWAYVDYHFSKNFNAHVGKYKIPQFLVSDYADVGYAYLWVRPPQDVYNINPLISISGLQLFYNFHLGKNPLLLQLFYGSGSHEVFIPASSLDPLPESARTNILGKEQTITTKKTRGAYISVKVDSFKIRVGYFDTIVDANFGIVKIEDASGRFSSAGFSFELNDLVCYSEIVSRTSEVDKAQAYPDQEAWYLTLGYRIGSFLPSITYSEINEGKNPSPISIEQKSLALGLRVELNSGSALKFEALEATPQSGNYGLFDTPVNSGKVYSLTLDALF